MTRRERGAGYAMRGKAVLVTGGNSGIGKATATALAAAGARTIITSRDEQRGQAAVDDIRRDSGSDAVEVMVLDLARLASVRDFCARFLADHDRLDVLVNNAGGMQGTRQVTEDGYELTFQVNHLGPFLLTNLLGDQLVASKPARVVTVASLAHKNATIDFDDLQCERCRYAGLSVYGRSKLANVLFARELARRLDGTGVTSNCLPPGTIRSGFGQDGDADQLLRIGLFIARPFFPGPQRGARTVVYLAASPEVEGVTGTYFVRCRPARTSAEGADDEAARRLWEVSERLVGLAT